MAKAIPGDPYWVIGNFCSWTVKDLWNMPWPNMDLNKFQILRGTHLWEETGLWSQVEIEQSYALWKTKVDL